MSDSQEIIVQAQDVAPVQQPPNIMAVIAAAVAEGRVDAATMQALLAMQREVMARQAEQEFNAALARVQPRLPRIAKRGERKIKSEIQGRYARYEDIIEVCGPIIASEGFAVSFDTGEDPKGMRVVLIVSHAGGHRETRSIVLPVDNSGSKNATQGAGSTFSYGQRYLFKGFFNIVEDGVDNDGAGDDAGYITASQAREIAGLIRDAAVDEVKFLKWLSSDSVAEIPAAKYEQAATQLRRKMAQKQGA
jgi:hypothetical protein